MDTPNPTPAATDNLKQWWNAKSFDGKEFCRLDDHGALTIAPFPEKVISVLNPVTGDTVLLHLAEKYKELSRQTDELKKEWENTEDKTKLISRLSRLKEQIGQANAVGNLQALLDTLGQFEKEIDTIVDQNYKTKQALLAEAESLTVTNNNWKELTQKFRDITDQWKAVGFVDKKRNEALWEKLEAVKNKFFEDKRVHQEEVGNEMLQNLDLKMEIVEKAEAHADSENWKESTEVFKQLMEEWKKTGRTIQEKNDALWERFIAAKNNFYDRKKLHTDQIRVQQEENFAKKEAIAQKAEAMKDSTDWGITAQAFNELWEEWKKIGSVPAEHTNTLWNRFIAAKEHFYQAKRQQAESFKNMLKENLARKTALIERAESIKNSNEWHQSSDEMNNLLDQWKQIGPVGKEHSDTLWEKFISARKHFFNRKDKERQRKKEQYERHREVQNIQTRNHLITLENESADEQAQIEEFKESLTQITDGPKAEELKAHLTQLIKDIEQRIQKRARKIEEIRAQVKRFDHPAEENTDGQGTDTVSAETH